jgi:hypothetical protein
MPATPPKRLSIASTLQIVHNTLKTWLDRYQAAFQLLVASDLPGRIHNDFSQVEPIFQKRVRAFLDTVHKHHS